MEMQKEKKEKEHILSVVQNTLEPENIFFHTSHS